MPLSMCQKTLTPSDEASVDAGTHSTAHNAHTHVHTDAHAPARHRQAHARHATNTHREGPSAHARRVPSDGHWALGTLHTYDPVSTQMHVHAAAQPCMLLANQRAKHQSKTQFSHLI